MADRLFAAALLLVAIGYSLIAFLQLEAPFQYDPLGPETWPRLLGLVAIACLAYVLARPDVETLSLDGRTFLRLVLLAAMLFAYAWAYETIGFVIATALFCTALSIMLGARWHHAALFGVATGAIGYLVCTILLDLNLPAGPIVARFL